MQKSGLRPVLDRAPEQMYMEIFDNSPGAQRLLDDCPILDDPVMAPAPFDHDDHFLWCWPCDIGCAVKETDRFEDAEVRRLQSEPAIEGASNYVSLDRISPPPKQS